VVHCFWLPVRLDRGAASDQTTVNGFARLAPDATLEKAQAELTGIGVTIAEREVATDQRLHPVVEPYAVSFGMSVDVPAAVRPLLYAINLFFVMLLVLICANVALLMFARAMTREGEIVVRNALGATRGRIMMQLFAEALVLGGLAALVGLVAAHFTLDAFHRVYEIESEGRLPFWFEPALSPATLLYAGLLALIAAGVAGVLPALKMTGRKMDTRLRQLAAGGGGLRFGRVWTVVIVAQVAMTVTFPAGAYFVRSGVVATQTMDVGFPAEQYLSARLELDRAADFHATTRELTRRLAVEPGVASVTLTDRLPRTPHPARRIELEAGDGTRADVSSEYRIATASVDLNYFEALGAPVLAGRAFHSGDLNSDTRVVIVNESFVQRVLGGRNPLGQRVRYVDVPADQQRWFEIVGAVKDLGMVVDAPGQPGIYHALSDNVFPIYVAIQLRTDPGAFSARLRALAASVDPRLQVHNVLPLTEVGSALWLEFDFVSRVLAGLSAIALLLSLAGIYAVTSFTVARRTREIGIRVALGADARGIITTILGRPVRYVGIGILAGGCMTGALAYGVMRDALGLGGGAVIVAYATLMMGVCMLACVIPARRALRVQPTEALRHD
jgi:predicted permease